MIQSGLCPLVDLGPGQYRVLVLILSFRSFSICSLAWLVELPRARQSLPCPRIMSKLRLLTLAESWEDLMAYSSTWDTL